MPGDRRPLAAVLAANAVSITGSSLTQLAVPLFVLHSTGSAGRAGVVALCTLLPVVLVALVGGPVIDRVGRLRVGVASDLVCALAVAAVPVLHAAGHLRFWLLCALMAVTGLCHAPGETARDVLLPTLAGRAGMPLVRAAGLYDGAARCAGLTGAALGGVLIAVLGAPYALLLDAATFLVSALLLAVGLRGVPEARPCTKAAETHGYRRELAEGYRFVAATPLLLGVCLMTLVTRGLDQGWSAVLLPVHAQDALGGAVDLGVLEASFGAGALVGALAYGAVGGRFRRWPVFTVALLVVGLPRFVVAAGTDTVAPLAVMMAVEGLACGVLNPILATVLYETVPEALRSRVVCATTAAFLTVTPLGGLAAGLLVDGVGLSTALLLTGGGYLLATLCPVVFPVWRQLDGVSARVPRAAASPRGVRRGGR
ncbi:MFS transporter [Streptomyces sp. NPDC051940]|uniref:MFS transporter n=1 Tax=Streptomyces sp. NPDC051940 TaxID=3155675 RepID=UPI0034337126